MTNRRTRKKTNSSVGNRGAAFGSDVSGSAIITGNQNVVQLSPAASTIATALHQLRSPVGDFVGREQEIESLIDSLRRTSRACISGINGMGGIGKTELALLVANRLLPDYPDAQFFINLQGTEDKPLPPHEVMAACIRAFVGPEAGLPEDMDQLSQLYRSHLSGKRALLLLDNAADDKQVLPLLPPTGCAVLVTSRQTIALPGITLLTLDPLTDTEARDLLLEIAPRAAPAAEQISMLCGYLPLAIRAAGSLIAITPDLGPGDYAAQLKDERNRLARIGTAGVELSVAASFNLSYGRLGPEAARVFRLLSVFPATFDAAAAEVVCDDTDHTQLSDLVRRSLVFYDVSTKRYRLHDLTRLFVDAKLSTEERTVGQRRHAGHYMMVLAAADDLYLQGGEALTRGLVRFDSEWANIQAGQAWAAAPGLETNDDVIRLAMHYANAGKYLLELRQHPREQIAWLEVALAGARQLGDRAHELYSLGNLGLAHEDLGEFQVALKFHEQCLSLAREIGDRRNEGGTLNNLGNIYLHMDENQRAIQFYEQRLEIARETADLRGEAAALANTGIAYLKLGETKRTIEFYEQALLIFRKTGDRRNEGMVLGNLGSTYSNQGESKRALHLHEQHLLIAREIGDRRGEGDALWNMSVALTRLGKRAEAIQCAEQSLTIQEEIKDPFAEKARAHLAALRNETD